MVVYMGTRNMYMYSAAVSVTEQAFLGFPLLTLYWEGARKGALKIDSSINLAGELHPAGAFL